MGCQKAIVQKIREKKADYVIAVKDNQANLHQDIQDWFAYADQQGFQESGYDYHKTINKGHGRIEIRECWVVADPIAFEYIRHYEGWTDLHSIVRVKRERRVQEKTQSETAYYISSLPPDATVILDITRQHWAVESSLHWVMDVTFREDDTRIRSGDSPQNMIVLRNIALNILKKDTSKQSLRQKRYKATLDDSFLLKLLAQF